MKSRIKELVHYYYWEKDVNCARTMLLSLSELFNIPIENQVVKAAIGLHGAGGFRAQCGLVEGSLMFIGIYFSQRGKSEDEITKLCFQFAESFQKEFSSIICFDLRPNGFLDSDPPHLCEEITVEAIDFTYQFINNR